MQWSRLFPLHKHICLKKSFQFFSNPISVFIHIHIHIYEATVLIWSFLQKLGLCMLYYRFISHLTKSALFFEINNILLKICIISSNQTCSLTYIQLLFNFSLKCHWLLPLHRNTHDSHGSTLSTSHTAGSSSALKAVFHIASIRTWVGERQCGERYWDCPSSHTSAPTSGGKASILKGPYGHLCKNEVHTGLVSSYLFWKLLPH